MDLSNVLHSLLHDTLIAKLHEYGFEMSVLKLVYSYLINRTQTLKVKGEHSTEHQIKSEVPQGSLLAIQYNSIFI